MKGKILAFRSVNSHHFYLCITAYLWVMALSHLIYFHHKIKDV